MAIRPLEAHELAEVLAVDFDDPEGIPKLKPDWRRMGERALYTSCSSLISIVESGRSRVVQFSHFSVKQFLTSARLASSSEDVSRYHVDLEPAHTVLAQACLSILLRSGHQSPLAEYAAQHWVTHAQFKRVSSFLQKAMECLFDMDKPYFAAWCRLHDMDIFPSSPAFYKFQPTSRSGANTPLYYAALCGFLELVGHLITKHPQHVGVVGGYYMTPAVAALSRKHFQVAQLLYHNGSSIDPRGRHGNSPLHSAVYYGDLEMAQILLRYRLDINAQNDLGFTPLHFISYKDRDAQRHLESRGTVARTLLVRGADVMIQNKDRDTPLHLASQRDDVEVIHVLLEYGVDMTAQNKDGETPLHLASREDKVEIARMLLDHGMDVTVQNKNGDTPLHLG